jgi:hypothetical protein
MVRADGRTLKNARVTLTDYELSLLTLALNAYLEGLDGD